MRVPLIALLISLAICVKTKQDDMMESEELDPRMMNFTNFGPGNMPMFPPTPQLTAIGRCQLPIHYDVIRMGVQILALNNTVQDAFSSCRHVLDRLTQLLAQHDIRNDSIRLGEHVIVPYQNETSPQTQYLCQLNFEALCKDEQKVGKLTEQLEQLQPNVNILYLDHDFTPEMFEKTKQQCVSLAMKDAQATAQLMAESSLLAIRKQNPIAQVSIVSVDVLPLEEYDNMMNIPNNRSNILDLILSVTFHTTPMRRS